MQAENANLAKYISLDIESDSVIHCSFVRTPSKFFSHSVQTVMSSRNITR